MQLFAVPSKSLELKLQLLGLAVFGHHGPSRRNRATTGSCRSYSRTEGLRLGMKNLADEIERVE